MQKPWVTRIEIQRERAWGFQRLEAWRLSKVNSPLRDRKWEGR